MGTEKSSTGRIKEVLDGVPDMFLCRGETRYEALQSLQKKIQGGDLDVLELVKTYTSSSALHISPPQVWQDGDHYVACATIIWRIRI